MDYSPLENLLLRYVTEHFFRERFESKRLHPQRFRSFVAQVGRLSDMFTEQRAKLRPGYLRDREARGAYLLYFHLASVARTFAVLEEMRRRALWPARPLKVLDLGAASAPSLWAVAEGCRRWGGFIESAYALDREVKALGDARALWNALEQEFSWKLPELSTHVTDLRSIERWHSPGKFDLVLCSNLINELPDEAAGISARWLKGIVDRLLHDDGLLILVEPALLRVSRRFTQIRDLLLEGGELFAPIPCGHQGKCPLNAEPRDWCHFEAHWNAPPLRKRLEAALGHRSGRLPYSYLVLSRRNEIDTERSRVLSDPLSARDGERLLICAPEKKIALRFPKPTREQKLWLKSVRRGDCVSLSEKLKAEAKPRPRSYAREVDVEEVDQVRRV